jgi:hypothetical protein
MDMDQGGYRWLLKTARTNYWRVAHWMDLDDLIQDGHWQWWRLCRKYPHVVDRPHMMRLFQLTFTHHLHDLANKRTALGEVSIEVKVADDESKRGDIIDRLTAPADIGAAQIALATAPPAIHRVLEVFATADGRRKLNGVYRRTGRKGGLRETANQRLCRLAGIPTSIDIEALFRQHFGVRA